MSKSVYYRYSVQDVILQIKNGEFTFIEFINSYDVRNNFSEKDLRQIANSINSMYSLLV